MKYRTIVADPPWRVHRPKGWGRGATSQGLPYECMNLQDIKDLPVEAWSADECHLYLWTINRYVADAYDVARAWGFRPSTLLTWCKDPIGVGPGEWFSITTEYVLFARRGSMRPGKRHPTTWFNWPRGVHSQKPEAFYDLVECVSPEPRLEMFARRARFGWGYFGDESLGTAAI
jgi:N6-adenosine-specific RNA methylase IME4